MSSTIVIQLLVIFGSLFLFMFLRFPVYICLALSTVTYMILFPGSLPVEIIGQGFVSGLNNVSFVAIVIYFLLGEIMNSTGLGTRLVMFLRSIIGWIPGSLSHVNIIESMVFAGVSGSTLADVASVGALTIPMMKEEGYPPAYSASVTACSSLIGPIIPPSGTFILMSIFFGTSVRRMFLAGLVPGLLMGFFELVVSYIISKRRHFPCTPFQGWKNVWTNFKCGFAAFLLPFLIMICLVCGIGTVVEIGAVSCLIALLLARVYGSISLKSIFGMLKRAVGSAATVFCILAVSGIFNWLLSSMGVASWIAKQLIAIGTSPATVVAFSMAILFLLGMLLDNIVLQTIIVPVMAPTIIALGINPYWWCVIATLVIMIGLCTPPVGGLIYVTSSMAGCTAPEFIKESLPFLACLILLVILLILFPGITTFVPTLLT